MFLGSTLGGPQAQVASLIIRTTSVNHPVGLITVLDGDFGALFKALYVFDELSGVVNTQAQNWLCSGRTSRVMRLPIRVVGFDRLQDRT